MCGMQSESIHNLKVLLTKADLTLEKALEISQRMEAATKSKEMKGSHRSTANSVLSVDAPAVAVIMETTRRMCVNSKAPPITTAVKSGASCPPAFQRQPGNSFSVEVILQSAITALLLTTSQLPWYCVPTLVIKFLCEGYYQCPLAMVLFQFEAANCSRV